RSRGWVGGAGARRRGIVGAIPRRSNAASVVETPANLVTGLVRDTGSVTRDSLPSPRGRLPSEPGHGTPRNTARVFLVVPSPACSALDRGARSGILWVALVAAAPPTGPWSGAHDASGGPAPGRRGARVRCRRGPRRARPPGSLPRPPRGLEPPHSPDRSARPPESGTQPRHRLARTRRAYPDDGARRRRRQRRWFPGNRARVSSPGPGDRADRVPTPTRELPARGDPR